MEWSVTHNGSYVLEGLEINPGAQRPDLTEQTIAASKEIRKGRHGHDTITVRVSPPPSAALESSNSAKPLYLPIGKIIFVHAHQDGSLKRANLFSLVCVAEESRVGGPRPQYICHTFKCRSEDEANELAFAVSRTMVSNSANSKATGPLEELTAEQLDQAVKHWNSSSIRMFHYNIGKDHSVSGVLKFNCQVDKTLKTVTKMVRLANNIRGDELIRLLGEKFNLGEINASEYAVFAIMDTGEQHMLSDDGSPIAMSLTWDDPSEGSFWLRKLPPGLVRVATRSKGSLDGPALAEAQAAVKEAEKQQQKIEPPASAAAPVDALKADTLTNTSNSSDHDQAADEHNKTQQNDGLGPLLPYHQDDEDLLLSVMIARQSGTGLTFKLTPAYLLQMCIAYCALHRGEAALTTLLKKIASQIHVVVAENPKNPEMLLFWACNAMKLMGTLVKDARTNSVYQAAMADEMNATVDFALKSIRTCAATGGIPLPEVLTREWQSTADLKALIQHHYETLDSNMSHDNLQEVVQRITAAMPSPLHKSDTRKEAEAGSAPARPTGLVLQDAGNLQASSVTDSGETDDVPFTSTPSNNAKTGSTPGDASILGASAIPHEETTVSSDRRVLRQPEPLPDEWEELVDQDTKHRFFANHLTRQTSWTDPRDTLRTVQLTKGNTGLGLGISGAKRTWDDRLVLGIFVSSLVPDSAAAVEGTLREGDEILEVNGHSLIGVSREGAIEFLKQVKLGDTVSLLVSQEPEYLRKPQLRHTAL